VIKIITIEWFRTPESEDLKNQLLENAISRIKECLDYREGELNFENEDFNSRGWWSIKEGEKK